MPEASACLVYVVLLRGDDLVSVRWYVWLVVNLGLLAVCITYGLVTDSYDAAGAERVVLGISMGGLGLVSVFLFPVRSRKKVL